jgi:hypothetical protein
LLTLALGATLLAGCMSDDDDNGSQVERAQPCDLYLRDQGVSVRMAGRGAERTCTAWLARRGETWSRTAGADEDSGYERVCVVYRGDAAAGLYSTAQPGSLTKAEDVCTSLTREGWEELNPPRTASTTTDSNGQPEASWFAPVLCAEGRCTQRGKEVVQPAEGSTCGEGMWTYVGISSDGQAGVFECLTEPDPDSQVTCDSFNERCTQAGHPVRAPETGAACGGSARRWEELPQGGSTRLYRCQ